MRLIPLMAMTALLAACAPDAADTASMRDADAASPAAVESVHAGAAAESDTARASKIGRAHV